MRRSKRVAKWDDLPEDSPRGSEDRPDDLDEDIIELDEVVESEMTDNAEAEFDVEILDVDSELSLKDYETPADSDEDLFLEPDFLEAFSVPRVQKSNRESDGAGDRASGEGPESPVGGAVWNRDAGKEAALSVGIPEAVLPSGEQTPTSPVDEPAVPPSVDEAVQRLEERLLAAFHRIVEEKLPAVVRSVLQEEIERLKRGQQLG